MRNYRYRSYDRRHSAWKKVFGPKDFSACCISGDKSTIYATEVTGYIYKSLYPFTTWDPLTSAGIQSWKDIKCSLDGSVILAVSNSINVSTNSGDTWTESFKFKAWKQCDVTRDGSKMVAFTGSSTEKCFKSTNFGASFSASGISGMSPVAGCLSDDGAVIYAANGNGGIYKTINGGVGWGVLSTFPVNSWVVMDCNSTGQNVFAASSTASTLGYIYASADGGLDVNRFTDSPQHIRKGIACSYTGVEVITATNTNNPIEVQVSKNTGLDFSGVFSYQGSLSFNDVGCSEDFKVLVAVSSGTTQGFVFVKY
ncbi:hypothetical protein JCM14076_06670 [Methylosoma difficile]